MDHTKNVKGKTAPQKNSQNGPPGDKAGEEDDITNDQVAESLQGSSGSILGGLASTIYEGDNGTTEKIQQFINGSVAENLESWECPGGEGHESTYGVVGDIWDPSCGSSGSASSNICIPQHIRCQDTSEAIFPLNTNEEACFVQPCSHLETAQSEESLGDRPTERRQTSPENMGNEDGQLVGLYHPSAMNSTSDDPSNQFSQPSLEPSGQESSSECSFMSSQEELYGNPTPPFNVDSIPLQIKYQDGLEGSAMGSQVLPQRQPEMIVKLEGANLIETEPELLPKSTLKRAAKRSASGDESDGEHSRSSKFSKTSEDSNEMTERSLACPFYKRNGNKYHDCRNNLLRRIKDVKQHIFRKHRKPDFYCPVCFGTFNEAISRDAHIQERRCTGQPDPVYDGISEDQKKSLSQCSSRGKPKEEQWNDIWKVIFPGATPPKSIYLGNYREEMIPQIREFWSEKREQIFASAFPTHPLVDQATPQVISSLMEKIFDLFEAEAFRWTPASSATNYFEPLVGSPPPKTGSWANDTYMNIQNVFGGFNQQFGMPCSFPKTFDPYQFTGNCFDEISDELSPESQQDYFLFESGGSETWALDM